MSGRPRSCFDGFGRPLKRLRAEDEYDPYNPLHKVPNWDGEVDELAFNGFISTSSSVMSPDGAREQVATDATLTVADPNVDIRRGDRIKDGGRVYVVDVVPSVDVNPFTGWQPTLEVGLLEVEG